MTHTAVNKLIIAGGRDYQMTRDDIGTLDSLPKPDVVLCGGASGADLCGKIWAYCRDIPVEEYPADWKKHGRAAGPIRNAQMAAAATSVVLFPGGRGTRSMREHALQQLLNIYDHKGFLE